MSFEAVDCMIYVNQTADLVNSVVQCLVAVDQNLMS
jgi:hypothetical protein